MELKYDGKLVNECINSMKVLSADAVEKACSGHPGMPLGCSDVAFILWHYFLKFNPKDPKWLGRDIFVLSAGHASMMLYSLLHLYDFGVSIDDIKNFRQLNSITPGHPEYGLTPGVETTTGPLGQGFANGVGFAIANKMLQAKTGEKELFDSKIYAIVSDGDIMEGITNESASIAGHLGLDNLIYIYDSNRVSIEGPTDLAMSENVGKRFEALGWKVMEVDGFDHSQIMGALNTAKRHTGSPVLIIANTIIGKGANKKEGKSSAHGEPLGQEELACLRTNLNWTGSSFDIPTEVYEFTKQKIKLMEEEYKDWNKKLAEAVKKEEVKKAIDEIKEINIADELYKELRGLVAGKSEATRSTSGRCIQVIAKHINGFAGGSADLGPSNKTVINGSSSIKKDDFKGKNLHFGIREHAMGGIVNGMSLYGGVLPYASTFLIFSDYMRPSIRLASLMKRQVVYVFTHDSIFVGEDGPTHQPIEQLSSLRLIPGLTVMRPCDEVEAIEAWLVALENKNGPTALLLTRQNIEPVKDADRDSVIRGVRRGGYTILAETGALRCVVAASGSEVSLAVKARQMLRAETWMRIVSIPCMERFLAQDKTYKESVIPSTVKKVSIEAGTVRLWDAVVGTDALKLGIDDFGTSAPGEVVAKYKGLDVD
ncbi:MAG: transketolase, partial [bacterium]